MPEIVQKQLAIRFDPPLKPTADEIFKQAQAAYYTLGQDEEWIDIEGQRWRLREMASSHLANLQGYLLKHSRYFFEYYCWGEAFTEDAFEAAFPGHGRPDDVPMTFDDWSIDQSREWIATTKLFKAIVAILDKRHVGVSFGEVVG